MRKLIDEIPEEGRERFWELFLYLPIDLKKEVLSYADEKVERIEFAFSKLREDILDEERKYRISAFQIFTFAEHPVHGRREFRPFYLIQTTRFPMIHDWILPDLGELDEYYEDLLRELKILKEKEEEIGNAE